MPRVCTICSLPVPTRNIIDATLVQGGSLRSIATAYSLNHRAVHRHSQNCLPRTLAQAAQAAVGQANAAPPVGTPTMTGEAAQELPQAASQAPRRRRGIMLDDAPATRTENAPVAPQVQPTPVVAPAAPLDLLGHCRDLRDRAMNILAQAEQANDPKTALQAIQQARGVLDSLAKLEERAQGHGQAVPLVQSSEWHRTRSTLLASLADHPEARIAAATALLSTGALELS